MNKSVDIYKVTRRSGIQGEVELILNNDVWNLSKTEVAKKLVDGLNKNLTLGAFIKDPFVSAKFIKRTIVDM